MISRATELAQFFFFLELTESSLLHWAIYKIGETRKACIATSIERSASSWYWEHKLKGWHIEQLLTYKNESIVHAGSVSTNLTATNFESALTEARGTTSEEFWDKTVWLQSVDAARRKSRFK